VCGSHNFLIVPRGCEKAFDKVAHQLLLQKLKLYKVNPVIINGITSLLCFRKQRVRLNGFFLEPTEVITGIPQGTILGPIGVLFIIYINDIQICANNLRMYICLRMMQSCLGIY